MTSKDEFLTRLLNTFWDEANEYLVSISTNLVKLEQMEDAEERGHIVELVYRHVHSLKGAARAVEIRPIGALCQEMENAFAHLKKGTVPFNPEFFDAMHRAVGGVSEFVRERDETKSIQADPLVEALRDLYREADKTTTTTLSLKGDATPSQVAEPTPEASSHKPTAVREDTMADLDVGLGTIRIESERLNQVMLQAEEMISAKLSLEQRAKEIAAVKRMAGDWTKRADRQEAFLQSLISQTAGSTENGRSNGNHTECELEQLISINSDFRLELSKAVAHLKEGLHQDTRYISRTLEDLSENLRHALMLPIARLTEGFPGMVRALARESGKEVCFKVEGESIELDKRVLEKIRSPIIHAIRNCIDHGVETPDEREERGKERRATVQLVVTHAEGNWVEVQIKDDGRGIDVDAIHEAAERLGLVKSGEVNTISHNEALNLICESGFTTAFSVSEVSGRGLGLPIVKESIQDLGGYFSIESKPGEGTRIHMKIPSVRTTFRGTFVSVADQLFSIPSTYVHRAIRIPKDGLRYVAEQPTIVVQDQVVRVAYLADILGITKTNREESSSSHLELLIVNLGGHKFALVVDQIHFDREIIVRSLGRQLVRVPHVTGATVLGTGQVVCVLDVKHMAAANASRVTGARELKFDGNGHSPKPHHAVLVVDDSITSRTLLKGILETAGYVVQTASDGAEAFASMKEGTFDVVVSDIEMPRLDGIELTCRIRSDPTLSETPVVLVTGLLNKEYHERGMDAGANAYIVKSEFEQSDLLDAVRRLV